MAMWCKALPLIASCLSPLRGFEFHPRHAKKLPLTWGLAVVYAGYSGFLHQLQLASHDLAAIWQKKQLRVTDVNLHFLGKECTELNNKICIFYV